MSGYRRRFFPTKAQREAMAPYRSMFEKHIAQNLMQRGIGFDYETISLSYTVPAEHKKYTPDFIVTTRSGATIMIEAKGLFEPADRKKAILVREANPEADIRFVFQNPQNTLSPSSKTTYTAWCEKNGFMWAYKFVPETWLNE